MTSVILVIVGHQILDPLPSVVNEPGFVAKVARVQGHRWGIKVVEAVVSSCDLTQVFSVGIELFSQIDCHKSILLNILASKHPKPSSFNLRNANPHQNIGFFLNICIRTKLLPRAATLTNFWMALHIIFETIALICSTSRNIFFAPAAYPHDRTLLCAQTFRQAVASLLADALLAGAINAMRTNKVMETN